MIVSFWITTIVLCTIASLFIIIPLKKSRRYAAVNQEQLTVNLYQQRLQELQEEFKAGLYTHDQLRLAQVELQQNLLLDVPTNNQVKPIVIKQFWLIAIVLLMAIPLMTYPLYWHLGAYKQVLALTEIQKNAVQVKALRKELGNSSQVIHLLKTHLAQDPTSARGWFLLGRLYASQQKFTQAAQAFAKADQLQPNDPDTLFQYAQAQYLVQRSLQGKPTALLQQLLKLQPQNDMAKNLIAAAAFERGDYLDAIKGWEQLLPHYPEGSPDQQALLNAIARAQMAAGPNNERDQS